MGTANSKFPRCQRDEPFGYDNEYGRNSSPPVVGQRTPVNQSLSQPIAIARVTKFLEIIKMRNVSKFIAALFLVGSLWVGGANASLGQDAVAEMRQWTDETGTFKTMASFVSLEGDELTLRREDGREIKIPLGRLGADDQTIAKRLAKPTMSTIPRSPRSNRTIQSPTDTASSLDASSPETKVAVAGTWPQWRGPNRDGISTETGLLNEWSSDGPPILWKASELGSGYSSVAVTENRNYTLGKFGGETRLVAMNAEDGNVLWATPVGSGDAPNCTPTVDSDLVFAVSHGGDLLCANAETGAEVWRKNFASDFGGKMMSSWGYSESPLVDGDRLIVTPGAPDAALAALNKRTGDVIWKSLLPPNPGTAGQDGAGYSSIVVSEAAGVRQYVQLVGRGVIGVEAATGQFLWGYNRVANGTANVPTPIISGNYVFCSSGYGDGGSALLQLTGGRGRINAQEVWYKPAKELQNHHGGMVLIGEHVFMGHGHNNGFPVCFHLPTGRDVWRPGRGPGSGSAAVVAADGHLYFRYEDGTMALIEAKTQGYQLKGQFKIGIDNGKSWAHPVVASGRLYLRDQEEMLCYDIRK